MIDLYFGASNNIPDTIENLDHLEFSTGLKSKELISNGFSHIIITGNIVTEEGQYPVITCSKAVKLAEWTAQGASNIPLTFNTIEKDEYYIYYIPTKTYDENWGGTIYNFTFKEGL